MSVGPAVIGDTPVENAWMYNNSYAGPTLVANPGDTLDLTIVNNLPAESNLHTHGLHVSPLGNSDNVLLTIPEGGSNHYTIQIPSTHPYGLNWYHPHRHETSSNQILRGLSGLLVIGRADGGAAELNGLKQNLLGLKNALIKDGMTTNPNPGPPDPAAQTYTINGQEKPTLAIRPGEWQMFDLGNIGNPAFYNLAVFDAAGREVPLFVTAVDGNPLAAARQVSELETPPGRRWAFTFQPPSASEQWTLRTKGFNDGTNIWPPTTLMTFDYTGAPVVMAAPVVDGSPLTVPNSYYRDLSALPESMIAAHRTVVFQQQFNSAGEFITMINGAQFPNNPVFQPRLNTVEEWTLINATLTDDHPFHLHTNPVQVLRTDTPPGVPNPYPNGTGFSLDVVNVPRSSVVVIRVEFKDFLGSAVIHCHRVEHEDEGMMMSLEVMPEQSILATGSGPGAGSQVNVYDGTTNAPLYTLDPYGGFLGGVNVAVGDVNNDGVSDVVTAPGAGGGPNLRVFNGKDRTLMFSLAAFDPTFTGGVNVAAGDIDGDGYDDIVCGAGPGGGPRVTVFSGKDGTKIRDFFAFGSTLRGGVTVAVGDFNGDGRFEIAVGAGAGGSPHVKVFSYQLEELASYFAYDAAFAGGVNVTSGRVRGVAFDCIITGPASGGGPNVRAFQAAGHMTSEMQSDSTSGGMTNELVQSVLDLLLMNASSLATSPEVSAAFVQSLLNLLLANASALPTGGGMSGEPMSTDQTEDHGSKNALEFTMVNSFFAYDPSFTGGVRVGSLNRIQGTNFLTGPGVGGGANVKTFDGVTEEVTDSILAGGPTRAGVSVAAN